MPREMYADPTAAPYAGTASVKGGKNCGVHVAFRLS